MYELRKKNGKGATWYMKADQLFNGDCVTVFSKDGFETIVNIRDYNIYR